MQDERRERRGTEGEEGETEGEEGGNRGQGMGESEPSADAFGLRTSDAHPNGSRQLSGRL